MLCQHIHWKVCTLTILHFIKLVCILPPPPKENFRLLIAQHSGFSVCINTRQILTREEEEKKKGKKKRGGEQERGNMHQSNSNGLQIFWLVKSYSLIVITVQHFFPPKTCSLQGIVCQTFIEKNCDSYCVVWRGMLVRNM